MTEDFIKLYNEACEMKAKWRNKYLDARLLLRKIAESPDDYIKHHEKASQWLAEVNEHLRNVD